MRKLLKLFVLTVMCTMVSCTNESLETDDDCKLVFEKKKHSEVSGDEVYRGYIVNGKEASKPIIELEMKDGEIVRLFVVSPKDKKGGIFTYEPHLGVGKTVFWSPNEKDTAREISFYSNGKQACEINFVQGKIHSVSSEYDSLGNRVHWSQLVNGNGYYLRWRVDKLQHDTVFVSDGEPVAIYRNTVPHIYKK